MRDFSALGACFVAAILLPAGAQGSTLTLSDALRLAKENNGTVAASRLSLEASRSGTNAARSAFLPKLSPTYNYSTSTTWYRNGILKDTRDGTSNSTLDVVASYKLLDSGERRYSYLASRANTEAQAQSTLQSLRNVLFVVHQQYFNALRSEELLRVQEAQLERAEKLLDATELRIEVGDAAKKDRFQADADRLNARVAVMTAKNRVATSQADLKSTIGWDGSKPLPPLQKQDDVSIEAANFTLDEAIARGVEARPDLKGQRMRVEAAKYDVQLARIDSGITYSVDASLQKRFSRVNFDQSQIGLYATIPLYDGARSREILRSRQYALQADVESLNQAERDARAEIEAAYKEFVQNRERVVATKAALLAAQENYKAAKESYDAGASSILEVFAAQVTLVTAESNNIEAGYDLMISDVRLKVAMGEPIPGE